MNLEQIVLSSELIASIAVVVSLIYFSLQVKQSNRVNSAASRHSISEFALELGKFRAEHADRWAKVMSDTKLTSGDIEFRNWNHMMLLLHAETCFHHYQLKLIPKNHWQGYVLFIRGTLHKPGFKDYRNQVGQAFSSDFSKWLNKQFLELDTNNE